MAVQVGAPAQPAIPLSFDTSKIFTQRRASLLLGAVALAGFQDGSFSNCKLPGSGQPLDVPVTSQLAPFAAAGIGLRMPGPRYAISIHQKVTGGQCTSVGAGLPVLRGFHMQVCITLEEPSPGNTIMHLKHTGIPHEDE